MKMECKMTRANATKLVAKVVGEVLDDKPIVRDNKVILEGGPFEWAVAVSLGSNIFAGEFGDYSKPLTGKLAEAKAKIESAGFFLEADNYYTLSVWEV